MSNGKIRLWYGGDLNAFFGLGTNVLVNLIVLTSLLLYVVQMPADIVFGRILPAVGLMLLITNFYFAFMARRLANKTGRTDVTALPSGPSVPHMFIVVLVVMLPVRLATDDPIKAWESGLAWIFIEGLVIIAGAFVAPVIRKITPRAALLGTLAGISIAFISLRPAMQIMMTPWIGLVCLGIIFSGWFGKVRFPFNAPAGLVAILVGTILAWGSTLFGGPAIMSVDGLGNSVANFGFSIPIPAFGHVFSGFENLLPLLVTAIPFGIYDFIEAMNNVESASAAGDEYSVRETLLWEGGASLVGTILGSPFANAVYIGHPGWKAAGGRIGYSLATGGMVMVVTMLGIISLLLALIPEVAIIPILLYIGVLIAAQAFQSTPNEHAPAVAMALVPHFAAWARTLIDGTLNVAGTSADQLDPVALANNGVLYEGLRSLGDGAILSGLIFGAIAVFIIDQKPRMAAAYALAGAVLAFFGFIHGAQIGYLISPGISLGYLMLAVMLFGFNYLPKAESAA